MVYKLCSGAYHVLKSFIAFGLLYFISGVQISVDSVHCHYFEERISMKVYNIFLAVKFLFQERLSLQIEVQRCVNEKTRSPLVIGVEGVALLIRRPANTIHSATGQFYISVSAVHLKNFLTRCYILYILSCCHLFGSEPALGMSEPSERKDVASHSLNSLGRKAVTYKMSKGK